MKAAGVPPRKTPKESHDVVIENLAKNADIVLKSRLADHFKVYSREALIFNDKHPNVQIGVAINKVLERYSTKTMNIKTNEYAEEDRRNVQQSVIEKVKENPGKLIETYKKMPESL